MLKLLTTIKRNNYILIEERRIAMSNMIPTPKMSEILLEEFIIGV